MTQLLEAAPSFLRTDENIVDSRPKLVEMKGVVKTFPGVKALTDIHLTLHQGEVLGLLGENGAGKSTLMNVLGGIYKPDSGSVYINGEEVHFDGVLAAQEAGIAFVHQELALEPFLTVAENIFIGREVKNKAGLVSQREMETQARPFLRMVGLDVDPQMMVNSLSMGQQQMVEIAKALSLNSRVIVLDEPTSSLSENEVENLFQIVRKLKTQGMGIIYISHKMSEIFDLTDNVMVMRDGCYVDTVPTSNTTEDELVHLMVGRDVENYYYRTYNEPGDAALELRDFACGPWEKPVNLTVRQREIVGVYGLIGAGRSELFETVMGLRNGGSGTVLVHGNEIGARDPVRMQQHGLAYVPEDRKTQGLFLFGDVMFNTSIASLGDFISWLRVNERKEKEIVVNAIETLNIKVSSPQTRVGTLSGGNQQKVVLGKWLATKPEILILDEPTRGVDVGAKAEIYKIINELAAQGVAVVFISSELNEVMNMSDRLAVMREGEIAAVLSRDEFNQDVILKHALG
ncbi:sugar ABC transporter ATP-binding protein [Bifidobacterium tsurumiense]|uniref:Monosaccharide ABC transporter, ATP-binding protein n=1 Tax=Bifidobacterium tsurumiense TaxID=356829 RepID=A0A087ECL3_9BIFI|nr:sugar ABC transporter ATP-binding protein [Bifidobacterium tsurumiense]KFJ05514.1 monosaccharide ABC transporter, ATP-binding protein [Bifidobacterium tsurumiense]MDY4677785.1 sugar ABC transporter ATP-binding protein [Bifidobacterium tsurumiense]